MTVMGVPSIFSKATVAVAGTALLLGGTIVSHAQQDPATASAPKIIEIVATRFAFEPAEIEVTEGDHVRLVVKSADGVHGLEIKKFRVQKKIPRGGDPVTIDFVAGAAGSFPIVCSEYCGDGHEDMKGTLVVSVRK
jgi:cytochrome c oxidase subunit 2